MRSQRWLGAILLAGLLCAAGTARAENEDADTESAPDEAVSACVTKCESEHDTCAAAAKAKTADCERQKAFCDAGCARCGRMKGGPLVVYCVNDCESCRGKLAASPCSTPEKAEGECTRTLDACLERCGP